MSNHRESARFMLKRVSRQRGDEGMKGREDVCLPPASVQMSARDKLSSGICLSVVGHTYTCCGSISCILEREEEGEEEKKPGISIGT